MSATKIVPLYVSQPSEKTHAVKLAAHVGCFVAVDCHCGQSSPFCENVGTAREWWREHAGLRSAHEENLEQARAEYQGD